MTEKLFTGTLSIKPNQKPKPIYHFMSLLNGLGTSTTHFFITETPNILNDPEQARHFVMSVVELLSSHTEEMKKLGEENYEMHSELKNQGRELKEMVTEKKHLTSTMKKLSVENNEIRNELQIQGRELKEMVTEKKHLTSTVEKLYDENKLLSGKIAFLSDAVMEIGAENKHLSAQVEHLAKENEEMTDTIKHQARDLSALNKTVTGLQNRIKTDQSSRQSSDLVLEETGGNISKRIVLHSDTDILSLVTTHGTEIQKLQTDLAAFKNGSQASSVDIHKLEADVTALKTDKHKYKSGSTYVRWGRTNCSGNGTELVYSGYAAGSDKTDKGAAANYICLSPDPLWGHYTNAKDADAKVMGVEYEFYGVTNGGDTSAFFHKNLHQEDAPCSVCRSPRSTVIMIPGRNQCYRGWTLEYKGYLVAGYYGHPAATEYVCLDDYPEAMPGGHADQDGKLMYMVEGRCGSLRCPPYVDGRELTCAVCSK